MKGRGIYKSESDYFPIRDSGAPDGLPVNLTLLNFTANLSTVNGTAFISNPSTVLTPYLNMKITLTAGGKTLVGWIKSAGTGETFNTEIITGWTNNAFDTLTTTGSTISSAIKASGIATAYVLDTTVAGALYKQAINLTVNSGTIPQTLVYKGDNSGIELTSQLVAGINNIYHTQVVGGASGSFQIGIGSGATNFSSTNSFRNVLLPSSTGVRIVSAKGNTTYNWTSNNGIDANATSFTAVISLS
jgi:hypothetical protein